MCTRHVSPDQAAIERFWHVGRHNQPRWAGHVFPRAQGPFLRPRGTAPERELIEAGPQE